ncbi:hypothetical protein, partial [Aquidulcibacter sp.]|uniref:hypothetical protein n=1 Tax=Aquidulcibacter sp. TaxID=2052990 RepID=UPI0025C49804
MSQKLGSGLMIHFGETGFSPKWVQMETPPSVRFAASFPMNGEAACPSYCHMPLPRSRGSSGEASEGVFQKALKRFGDPSGPRNRKRNCFCDIWIVKCAASLRRKRSVFEENGH